MAGTFVIGAGPGIGQAVARRFAREGSAVAVLARSRSTVDGAVAAVEDAGGKAFGLPADAADETSLRSGLDAAVERLGVPDVLVYNAAWVRYDRPGELSATELAATLRVNVVGAVSAVTHLAPRMAAVGGGTVLLTSGMPTARAAATSLSIGKAGLCAARAVLAEEFGPQGVHIATVTVGGPVAPGSPLDPDRIAEHYVRLARQSADQWESDVLIDGEAAD
ncbi:MULTISPECIES: SDR family NAD(P)-dependent oxidoreductase [unclassified Streptomyces]|uniref:SDR family NAD(P)-dependent oxidoreductase n=1 Tax=unclassified Streptomyces TaxID=2593676 RepID=UPI000C26EAA0|nr:SDR family NAD(P)-dependent oxidoreductase [Streptomyces sp. CB02959]PJN36389.1 short-chain dehydrogenase [Streptomyces sp. CB02959]